jgi:rare lipoprotein A
MINQKNWSGLTTAAFLALTWGVVPSHAAPSSELEDESSGVNVSALETLSGIDAFAEAEAISQIKVASPQLLAEQPLAPSSELSIPEFFLNPISFGPEALSSPTSSVDSSASASTPASDPAAPEAVKVGEYQIAEAAQSEEAIAIIQVHEAEGRPAATLYVRNIPVLTFLGSNQTSSSSAPAQNPAASQAIKVGSTQEAAEVAISTRRITSPKASYATPDPNDPVWRAGIVAARLNQMSREQVDANSITVTWDAEQERYLIRVGEDELVAIDPDDLNTILPDTTQDPTEDVLQATNRLRRLMGSAPPLDEIEGLPQPTQEVAVGPIRFSISGYASWYGPGFHGNTSASGEIFDENALTAAHPDLPFGTQVRVTNQDTGLSVVVRINDRGPYAGDRIIDLSAGAARVIGLMQSGVAPVRLDVLGTAGTASVQGQ